MKRLTAILLLAVTGLLAACNSPASSPGVPGDTFPSGTSPSASMEPSELPSVDSSVEPSADPSASTTP
jgi:hypothetical protein